MTFCSLINGGGKETIASELGVTARMCQFFGPGGANMHYPRPGKWSIQSVDCPEMGQLQHGGQSIA